jgi:uncharacterized protein YxjI
MHSTHAIEDSDRFLLRQRFRPVVNQYEFSLPGDDGGPGRQVCFAEQKRLSFKEDIRFYTDDSKQHELLRLKALQRFDPRARYQVTDRDGSRIGEIQKVFGTSLLRSSYVLFDADGREVATAAEKRLSIALLRRVLSVGADVADVWLPIPYHFVLRRGETVLGTHTRRAFKLRDTYTIDLSGDPARTLDRRLVLAMAVGMDALQAR